MPGGDWEQGRAAWQPSHYHSGSWVPFCTRRPRGSGGPSILLFWVLRNTLHVISPEFILWGCSVNISKPWELPQPSQLLSKTTHPELGVGSFLPKVNFPETKLRDRKGPLCLVICLPNWMSPFLWGRKWTARPIELWRSILALRRNMWNCALLWTL